MTDTLVGIGGSATGASGADWLTCPECADLHYVKRLRRTLWVCPACGHHLRVDARGRIGQLADDASFTDLELAAGPTDPLAFTDLRPYAERLGEAARRSGESEAVLAGTATIDGYPVVLVVMDFAFLGGSMGVEVGRRVEHAAQTALAQHIPLIAVCASGGARMQEGVLSLVQMTRTAQAFGRLHDAGLLSVCVLTDPTYGGVSASFAAVGSVVIAERGAHIGFAGPRVVEQTIRQELPPGFQTAEFLLAHGLLDRVEERSDLRPLLVRLLALHSQAGAGPAHPDAAPEPTRPDPTDGSTRAPDGAGPDPTADEDPWTTVQTARDISRPTTRDYLRTAFDDFVELHGDRAFGDDPALVGGIASLAGRTVVVLGQQKGPTLANLMATNFGMPHPEGYRKALRMLGYAERFALPVVTLVDTPGAYPGLAAEERGQFIAIAEMIERLTRIPTPVVSVILGEGGSGGALALCAADRLLMLEHSFLSVISPEGCAAILWRQADRAAQAARALRLGARPLHRLGIAHRVVEEPPGGVQADPPDAARRLRRALTAELDELTALSVDELRNRRQQRFSALDDSIRDAARRTETASRRGGEPR